MALSEEDGTWVVSALLAWVLALEPVVPSAVLVVPPEITLVKVAAVPVAAADVYAAVVAPLACETVVSPAVVLASVLAVACTLAEDCGTLAVWDVSACVAVLVWLLSLAVIA